MLKVNILAVGKLKEGYWRSAQAEYAKRLGGFVNLSIVEIAESNPKNEGDALLAAARGTVILLDIEGKDYSSPELSRHLSALKQTSSELTLIVGGSEGVSAEVKARADERISFSSMTFPHQLFRILLLEQLYRAQMIEHNRAYHK